MLYFDRTDVSPWIDANETIASKECIFVTIDISWILVLSFNQMFATSDLFMMSMDLSHVAILNIFAVLLV